MNIRKHDVIVIFLKAENISQQFVALMVLAFGGTLAKGGMLLVSIFDLGWGLVTELAFGTIVGVETSL